MLFIDDELELTWRAEVGNDEDGELLILGRVAATITLSEIGSRGADWTLVDLGTPVGGGVVRIGTSDGWDWNCCMGRGSRLVPAVEI